MPPQAPFSDAYVNGLPPKRRKVNTTSYQQCLLQSLQSTKSFKNDSNYCSSRLQMIDQRGITPSEDSIGDALKSAATATGATPLTSLDGNDNNDDDDDDDDDYNKLITVIIMTITIRRRRRRTLIE